jgi:hypothetical protein
MFKPFAPEKPCWIICQQCIFNMQCTSQEDAHELASAHLKLYKHRRVDVAHTLEGYRQCMSEKTLVEPKGEYHQNHRSKHRRLSPAVDGQYGLI